jgi:nitrate/TMAO reductase-like tetraheme cytochrome c subunit
MKSLFDRITTRLKNFFFPPPGATRWQRVLPYAILGLLTLVVLVAGAYGWEYTNSPEFCGTQCHTMPPQYSAYLVSPHARVACVECHIGRDFIATQISRKAGDIRHVVFTVFQSYEYPIYAKQMRPARDTCERCHFPEKFSDDSQRQIIHRLDDKENTPLSIYLILKTGGGSKRLGLGRGIHWHIENPIQYYATDKLEQNIPYVRVYSEDGTYEEYIDIESNFDPKNVNEEDLKEMDCITCHNRITHLVKQPEEAIDDALDRGLIAPSIPDLRRQAVAVMRARYVNEEQAKIGIAGLETYYQTVYPQYYEQNNEIVISAILTIQEIYDQSVHIEQQSDWDTHPNNIGHDYFPGCFRCHGGQHLNSSQEAVRLECNLCHSIPVVAGPYDFVANIEISRGPEPQTHLNANWIAQHHLTFDQTCANCHTTEDPGGTSNTSFCSNPACHGTSWEFAGFDAPMLRDIIIQQLPPTPTPKPLPEGGALTYNAIIGELLQARCGTCHGSSSVIAGLDLTTYNSSLIGGDNGPVIIPGDSQASMLVQKQEGDQPHFGQFPPEELQLIHDWISNGAPED